MKRSRESRVESQNSQGCLLCSPVLRTAHIRMGTSAGSIPMVFGLSSCRLAMDDEPVLLRSLCYSGSGRPRSSISRSGSGLSTLSLFVVAEFCQDAVVL